jgi:hypothetical protein
MTVLGQSKETSFITFAITSLSGPVLGVIMGGYTFTLIGGYNSPRALPVAVVIMLLGGFCGFPMVFV